MTNSFNKLQQTLKNMANKFKKQIDVDKQQYFKQTLRARLLEKAEQVSHVGVKRNWLTFKWLAPVTAVVVLIAVVTQFLAPGGNLILLPNLIDVASAYDEYKITPVTEVNGAVAVDSGFKLTSKTIDLDVSSIQANLTFAPLTEFDLEKVSTNEITIKPKTELQPGEIYQLALADQQLQWAFQINDGLRVTSTVPGKYGINAPINSGIEITFSHAGLTVDDYKKMFSISPAVAGRFENRGKTMLFVPDESLAPMSIYTVTIKGRELGEYSFEFETGRGADRESYFSIMRSLYEFSPLDNQGIEFYDSANNEQDIANVALTVYQYPSGDAFLNERLNYVKNAPSWTSYQSRNYKSGTTNLTKIVDLEEYEARLVNGRYQIGFPDKLPAGYFLIKLASAGGVGQAFLQVTNTATYIDITESASLVWVNDIATGKPVVGAKVSVDKDVIKTGKDGVALFNYKIANDSGVVVETEAMTTYYVPQYSLDSKAIGEDSWNLFMTDRTVYKPTDTVKFSGFLQGRFSKLRGKAEVILVDDYFGARTKPADVSKILAKQGIELDGTGSFSGEFSFANLNPNQYYTLAVYQDDNWLMTEGIAIEDYVKPAYGLDLQADKYLYYYDEDVNLEVKANFFDGTPVPQTKIKLDNNVYTTDDLGKVTVKLSPDEEAYRMSGLVGGDRHTVTTVSEELGYIADSLDIVVYQGREAVENVEFDQDGFALNIAKIDLNKVDRNALSIPDLEDIIVGSAANVSVVVNVEGSRYDRVLAGEYYDYVGKVTRKKYEYKKRTNSVMKNTFVSDANGEIDFKFDAPLDSDFNYTLSYVVKSGRDYQGSKFLNLGTTSTDSDYYSLEATDGRDWNQFNYKIGETVSLTAVGPKSANTAYLFMNKQVGGLNYKLQSDANYEFKFGKEDVPNVYASMMVFNGRHYSRSTTIDIGLDTSDRELTVNAKATKAEYAPSDEADIEVEVKDANTGKPVAANLTVRLVDEAYYALFSEALTDPLGAIYKHLYLDGSYSYLSHTQIDDVSGEKGGCFLAGTKVLMADGSYKVIEDVQIDDQVKTRASEWDSTLVNGRVTGLHQTNVDEYLVINERINVTGVHVVWVNNQWQLAAKIKVGDRLVTSDGEEVLVNSVELKREFVTVYNFEVEQYHTYFAEGVYVHNDKGGRSDFKDTAYFASVNTDSSGKATLKVKLPDNITEWRLSVVAISGGDVVRVGRAVAPVVVTQDLFALPVISADYNVGDKPQIPVRAFGKILAVTDKVDFEMIAKTLGYNESKTGKAFSNSYFALPLKLGEHVISTVVKAKGKSDKIELPIEVVDSRFKVAAQAVVPVTEGMPFAAQQYDGRVNLTFVNQELGKLYPLLSRSLYNNVDRADYVAGQYVAGELLNEYYKRGLLKVDTPVLVYQEAKNKGGISLFAYSDASLEATTKLAILAPALWNQEEMKIYFNSVLSNKNQLVEKLQALAGLAGLKESVLVDLDYLVANQKLNKFDEQLWVAVAYAKVGAKSKAADWFRQAVVSFNAQEFVVPEDAVAAETMLAYVASELNSDQRDRLWQHAYATSSEFVASQNDSVLLEQLIYTKSRLGKGFTEAIEFKVNSKKVKLVGNQTYEMNLLPKEIASLKVSDIKGDLVAVTDYAQKVAYADVKQADVLKIKRSYWVDGKQTTAFSKGDIVKVVFDVNVGDHEGSYVIGDILPSGLKVLPVVNYAEWSQGRLYLNYQLGQNVRASIFCVIGDNSCNDHDYYYYARVVNPGEFVTEPATLQNLKDKEQIVLSGTDKGVVQIR